LQGFHAFAEHESHHDREAESPHADKNAVADAMARFEGVIVDPLTNLIQCVGFLSIVGLQKVGIETLILFLSSGLLVKTYLNCHDMILSI
jgi:hypothetical protein